MADNRRLRLTEEAQASSLSSSDSRERKPWTVLIVDDDDVVHDITRQVLFNVRYEGRKIEFLSAYSGGEAKSILQANPGIAAILLDVVMETEDAGLDVADYIRNELRNEFVRIILRTGQPGMAPERKIILDYDINDYKDKTELTATKLFTALISSLRDFSLLTRLNRCLQGMESVVVALRELLALRSFRLFAEGLLAQVLSLLNLDEHGLYVDVAACAAEECEGEYIVIAGTGDFADPAYREGRKELPKTVRTLLDRAASEQRHLYVDDLFVGYIPSQSGQRNRLLYLSGVRDLDDKYRHLLETFLSNVNVGFDTVMELEELRARDV